MNRSHMLTRACLVFSLLALGCLGCTASPAETPPGSSTSVQQPPQPPARTPEPQQPEPPQPEPPQPEPPQPEPPAKSLAVDMSALDNSCKRDRDCTNVNPLKCSHCGCSNTPIAVSAMDAFKAAYQAIKCPPPSPEDLQISCGGCPGYIVRCKDGQCVAAMH